MIPLGAVSHEMRLLGNERGLRPPVSIQLAQKRGPLSGVSQVSGLDSNLTAITD